METQELTYERACELRQKINGLQDAPDHKYKIYFLNVAADQKKRFLESRCLFFVSVGQHYHEGEKLLFALKCMKRNFKEVTVMVGDTIQRYTHAIYQHKTPEELFDFAETEGTRWLERNKIELQRAGIEPSNILRWDIYRTHPFFSLYLAEVSSEIKMNKEYSECFRLDTVDFLARPNRQGVSMAPNSVELCMEFLKEECACLRLFADAGYEFFTYPYGMLRSPDKTYELYIQKKQADGSKDIYAPMQKVIYGIKKVMYKRNMKQIAA